MRRCATTRLKPGMTLARPIYDKEFRMLLSQGSTLTENYISHLKKLNFPAVFIQEDDTDHIIVKDPVKIEDRKQICEAYKGMEDLFPSSDSLESKIKLLRKTSGSQFTSGWLSMMRRSAKNMIRKIAEGQVRHFMPSVELSTNLQFNHSMDVALLSMMIGMRFHYNDEELTRLAQAALLHDCGKVLLGEELGDTHPQDYSIRQKKLYLHHPQLGAQIVDKAFVNHPLTLAILQHHERQDGSGYPGQVKGSGEPPYMDRRESGSKIYRHAEIIAVANYYDNLVKGRITREYLTPMDAVSNIISLTPQWFNSAVVEEAVSTINVFPEGSNVYVVESRRKNVANYTGVVAEVNPEDLKHPKVLLLYNSSFNRLKPPVLVDFSEDSYSRLRYIHDMGMES